MKKQEFDKINELEATHWWYVGTREISFSILGRFLSKSKRIEILDVGCGTGGNMKELEKYGNVTGVDVDPYAVHYSKEKGLKVQVAGMEDVSTLGRKFDLITLFDVFNQADPRSQLAILKTLKESLTSGGILLMREPALSLAGGRHDIEVGIKQRFSRNDMDQLLTNAGFKILYNNYLVSLLFPFIVAIRKIQMVFSKAGRSDVAKTSTLLNFILLAILRIENWIKKTGIELPFGVSILVVATPKIGHKK